MVNVSGEFWTVTQSLALLTAANLQQALLPQLQPFNGENACSVVDLIESTGGLPPPPTVQILINAIEEAFSKTLKVNEALWDIRHKSYLL